MKFAYSTIELPLEEGATREMPGFGLVTFDRVKFKIAWADMPYWRVALTCLGITYFAYWSVRFQFKVTPPPVREPSEDWEE